MNKIYRTLWNAATQSWVVVSELAKSGGKSASAKKELVNSVSRFTLTTAATSLLLVSGQVFAETENGAGFDQTKHKTCYYNPTSQNAICGDDKTTAEIKSDSKPSKSVVIGSNAKTAGESNIVVGVSSETSHTASIAIGAGAQAKNDETVAIGKGAKAEGQWDISIGRNTGSTGSKNNNIAVGDGALKDANGTNNIIAIGTGSSSSGGGSHNVAIGTEANKNVNTNYATAVGYKTSAAGQSSVAVGNNANSKGITSVAIGSSSEAKETNSIAVGNTAKAGASSVAVGAKTDALQPATVAVGVGSKAGAQRAIAMGENADASGQFSIAIGTKNVKSAGGASIAIGQGTKTEANNSVAIGTNAAINKQGQGSVAIGASSSAHGVNATAIGQKAEASGQNSFAGGQDSHATGKSAVAVGDGAKATKEGANASGVYSKAFGTNTIALGNSAQAGVESGDDHSNSIAVGTKAKTQAKNAIAMGNNAQALAENTISVGSNAGITDKKAGSNAIFIGVKAGHSSESADNTVAIGTYAGEKSKGNNNVAVGRNTLLEANGNANVALSDGAGKKLTGNDNFVASLSAGSYLNGNSNIAIGKNANSGTETEALSVSNTIALGENAQAKKSKSIAMGMNAKANVSEGDVALGSGSETAAAVGTTEATVNEITYSGFAGTAPQSTVSVGKAGEERTITNVAAGRINATSTDAINGSQLYLTQQVLGNVGHTVTNVLGGDAEIAKTGPNAGSITMSDIGGTGKNTINDAIKASRNEVEAGKNMTVTSKVGANGQTIYEVATKDNVEFKEVKVGPNVTINESGLQAGNIKVDANTNKISGLANGDVSATSTDAVNGSQLHATNLRINQIGDQFDVLNNRIDKMNRNLRAGIAGANAAAGLPQAYIPGKSMVAAAVGTYKGENAIAVGMSRISDNGKVIIKLTGNTNSRGDFGGSIGAGYQW